MNNYEYVPFIDLPMEVGEPPKKAKITKFKSFSNILMNSLSIIKSKNQMK